MAIRRQEVDRSKFNSTLELPYQLRIDDFDIAMQDVYDFFHDVNTNLIGKGLHRMEDMLRPAALSGMISDMLTASLARHARSLTENGYFNGHPDLIVQGVYPNDSVQSGSEGVEVKTTKKRGGAVDMHGSRDQWLAVFVYVADTASQPATSRDPLRFTEAYLGHVTIDDFRHNPRGRLGTRTATLHAKGIAKLRSNWLYLDR